ncbi:MAG: hypothetical protein J4O01_09480 [Chloroflexi bacterium]|nr:hypothetical protein [Chloroflexota bacterium]MCI0776149.1 hypothetical protein [Chloroflexota bacterium]MCI0803759.1 hypothetical protein [Chloroflexota bacterium]MCI0809593.1 hypothetical protein [Chloroflexota bacterium]MCI0852270.1 hypothetical protein [Chloroflexota bacterium]
MTKLDPDSAMLDNRAVLVSNLNFSYEFVRHVRHNIRNRREHIAHLDQMRSRLT